MSEKWSYCPECGSDAIHYEEGDHKQCADCHQEWFADLDYSDVVRKHLIGHYSNWITTVERKDAALAAKDARIAELDGLLEHAKEGADILQSFIDNIETNGNYSAESTVNFLRQAHSCLLPAFADQQQAEPCELDKRIENAIVYGTSHPEMYATPSEDGLEVPEVVAWIRPGSIAHLKEFGSMGASEVRGTQIADEYEPLMTVAQHERIVDAYRVALIQARSETPVVIDVQPARQVGDDRAQFEAWHNRFYGPQGEFNPIRSLEHHSEEIGLGYVDPVVQAQFVAFIHALAPAAVAVVMPSVEQAMKAVMAKYYSEPCPHIKGTSNWCAEIGKAVLDEVARLNRSAIPLELLRKLAHCTEPDCCIAYERVELRALLGKDDDK